MKSQVAPFVPMVLILAIEAFVLWPPDLYFGDWPNFWYAGHLVATGRSPYDVANYAGLGPPFGWVAAERQALPWPYPPWTGLALAPFGALPLDAGIVAMRFALLGLGIGAVLLLSRQLPLRLPWTQALMLAIAAAYEPFVRATRSAHFDGLLLIGVLLVVAGWRYDSAWRFALGAVFLVLKPHIVAVLAIAGLVALLWDRRWRALAATAAALVGLAGIGWAVSPMPSAVPIAVAWLGIELRSQSTTWALGELLAGTRWPVAGIALLVVPLWLCVRALRASPPRRSALFVLAAAAGSLALAPYAQSYDYVLLLPILWLLARSADDRPQRSRYLILGLAFVLGALEPWTAYFADRVTDTAALRAAEPLALLLLLPIVARTANDVLAVARRPARAISVGRRSLGPESPAADGASGPRVTGRG